MSNGKALKSGIWFTVSNFITRGIGFITTPVFTRLMTKSEYGDFSNIQTWMMIMLYITSLDLEASLIRASYDFKEDLNRYVHSLIALSMLSTSFFWMVSILFRDQFISLFSMESIYIDCMFIYLLFCPAVNIFQNVERYQYKYKWTVAISLGITVGASLLAVILVFLMNDKLLGRTMGFIIPTIVIGLIISVYYIIKGRSINLNYWKYAIPISLPYIPHLLSMYLLSNMDRVMIKRFIGSESAALYSLAYTCGMIITILVTSINSAFGPWLVEKLSSKEYSTIRKMSVPYVAMFSAVAFGMVLITPEILYILGGVPYLEARHVMPPVAAGCLLQFVYCMYVNVEQYEKKTVGMAIASAVAAGLNFILNYICIPHFGYIAAAYTTYVGYFVLLILHMWFVRRLGMSAVYDSKRLFTIAVIASTLMFLSNVLLDMNVIRWCLVIVYMLILSILIIRNRTMIKKIVEQLRHS